VRPYGVYTQETHTYRVILIQVLEQGSPANLPFRTDFNPDERVRVSPRQSCAQVRGHAAVFGSGLCAWRSDVN